MRLLLRTLPPLLAGVMLVLGVLASPAPGAGVAAPAPMATPAAVDGFVMSVSRSDLVAQLADGSEHTYHLAGAAAVPITRNGQKSSLAALQQGDQLTLTLGPGGAVLEIDAAGPASPTASTAPQPSPPPATAVPVHRALGGTLAAASDQSLTVQLADGTRRDFHPAAQVHVTRNGQDGALSALRPGDQVIITVDEGGAVTSIDAAESSVSEAQAPAAGTRTTQGQVVTVWNAGIAVRLAGGVRDYRLAGAPRVMRNGAVTSLATLQAGDAVTLTTDATNRVTALVATGAPSQARTITATDAAGIVAPPLALLALVAGGLWYRRARRTARLNSESRE